MKNSENKNWRDATPEEFTVLMEGLREVLGIWFKVRRGMDAAVRRCV